MEVLALFFYIMNRVHKSFILLLLVVIIVAAVGFIWFRLELRGAPEVSPPPPPAQTPPEALKSERIIGVDTRILLYSNGRDEKDATKYVGTTADVITIIDAYDNSVIATVPTTITPDARGTSNPYRLVGDKIYFYHQGDRMVESLDFTGKVTKLTFTQHPQDRVYANFIVSEDGTKIAWARAARSGSKIRSALWAANIDGVSEKLLLEKELDAETYISTFRWSKDLSKVYFSEQAGGRGGYTPFAGQDNLFVVDSKGANTQSVLPKNPTSEFITDLSPDESKILVFQNALNNEKAIPLLYLVPTQEKSEIVLPPAEGFTLAGSGKFSPDNEQIALNIAKGNPVDEEIKIIVTNIGGQSTVILDESNKEYRVERWISNTTLLLSEGVFGGKYFTVNSDGTGLKEMNIPAN